MIVAFVVHGEPVGKGRPRMTLSGHIYTPGKTREAENRVRVAAREVMAQHEGGCISVPVTVSVLVEHGIPPSWSLRKMQQAIGGEIRPGRPDLDNVVKLALDAINGLVISDDKLVAEITATKRYSTDPKIRVVVSPIIPEAPA